MLWGEYESGKLKPLPVELGEMPSRAGRVHHEIAEHMRLLMGLRRAAGDERPLPYAVSVPVTAGFVSDAGNASAAIRGLVRMGVVEHVGEMQRMPGRRLGTKLYAPPGTFVPEPPKVERPGLHLVTD